MRCERGLEKTKVCLPFSLSSSFLLTQAQGRAKGDQDDAVGCDVQDGLEVREMRESE